MIKTNKTLKNQIQKKTRKKCFVFCQACETQTEIIIINHKDNPFSSETKNQVVEKLAKISYLNNNKNDTSVKLLFTKISESMYYNLKEKK